MGKGAQVAAALGALAAVATAYLADVSAGGWVGVVRVPATAASSGNDAPTTTAPEPFTMPTDDEAYGPVLIGGETADAFIWNLRYAATSAGARVCLEDHTRGYEGEVACYELVLGNRLDACGNPGQWAIGFGGMWEPRKGVLWGTAHPGVNDVRINLQDGSTVPAHFGYAPDGVGLRVFTAIVPESNPPTRVVGEGGGDRYEAPFRQSTNELTRHQIFDDPSAGGGLAYRPPFGNCGG